MKNTNLNFTITLTQEEIEETIQHGFGDTNRAGGLISGSTIFKFLDALYSQSTLKYDYTNNKIKE